MRFCCAACFPRYRAKAPGKRLADVSSAPYPLFSLLTHLTFTHTLFQSTFFGIVGAFWSLGLEAQFYVAFPFVIWAFARFGPRVLWALVGVSLFYYAVISRLGWSDLLNAQNFFLGRWMQFALGMAAALFVAKCVAGKRTIPAGAVVGLLGLSLFLLLVPKPNLAPLLSLNAVYSLSRGLSASALLIAVCTSTMPLTWPWNNRASAGLGFISYSFFLIHQPTTEVLSQLLPRWVPGLTGAPMFFALVTGGFVVCLALSYGFFLLFEKRFLSAPRAQAPISQPV